MDPGCVYLLVSNDTEQANESDESDKPVRPPSTGYQLGVLGPRTNTDTPSPDPENTTKGARESEDDAGKNKDPKRLRSSTSRRTFTPQTAAGSSPKRQD